MFDRDSGADKGLYWKESVSSLFSQGYQIK